MSEFCTTLGKEVVVVFSLITMFNYSVTVDPELSTLPPVIGHGLAATKPIGNGWSYVGEADVVTPMGELHPGVQVLTGPSKKFSEHFALGATVSYKIVPSFDEAVPSTHVVGLSLVPIIPTDFGAVSFPTGVAYLPAADALIVVTNVKFGLRL